MSHFILSQEDGSFALGRTGYYVLIAVLLLALLLSAVIVDKKQKHTRLSVKRLAFCGVAIAMGFVLSFVKIHMPYGGSATAFSMLCICIIGYFYGIKAGLLSAAAYSILQFFQNSTYILSPMQVCCDYFFAFTALGITGFFYKKNKFILGYFFAIMLRGLFHSIGGYLYWMDYMPDNFPQILARVYPIVYNYSFILAEGALTLIVISMPPVKKGLGQIRGLAMEK